MHCNWSITECYWEFCHPEFQICLLPNGNQMVNTNTETRTICIILYLTSSKQIPQIKMSTFFDEAETSLDACRQKSLNFTSLLIFDLTPLHITTLGNRKIMTVKSMKKLLIFNRFCEQHIIDHDFKWHHSILNWDLRVAMVVSCCHCFFVLLFMSLTFRESNTVTLEKAWCIEHWMSSVTWRPLYQHTF